MFFFGLFSTHIPYIILAIAYSIGIGAYSINYINSKFSDKKDNKEWKFSYSKYKEYNKTYFYFQSCSVKKVIDKETENADLQKNYFRHFLEIKDFIICSTVNIFSSSINFVLFNRPPPAY